MVKKPVFKFTEEKPHPWPDAPAPIKAIERRLLMAKKAAEKEYADLTEMLLDDVLANFWDTMLEQLTACEDPLPLITQTPPKAPKAPPVRPNDFWEGYTSVKNRAARERAVLEAMNGHWFEANSRSASNIGAPAQKLRSILAGLEETGRVETRRGRLAGKGRVTQYRAVLAWGSVDSSSTRAREELEVLEVLQRWRSAKQAKEQLGADLPKKKVDAAIARLYANNKLARRSGQTGSVEYITKENSR